MEGKLILYNDSKHTMVDVIDMIWIATGHDELQCEQLAVLAHTKGNVVIKKGDIDELIPMKETLELERYKVKIELCEV
jgi:ATP-dependent Clp protease adaptor protein ClpS